jgi:hypothetical protein
VLKFFLSKTILAKKKWTKINVQKKNSKKLLQKYFEFFSTRGENFLNLKIKEFKEFPFRM